MSSRRQDSEKLLQLAEIATENANNLHQAASVMGRFNESLTGLERNSREILEAIDDLERRLMVLEALERGGPAAPPKA